MGDKVVFHIHDEEKALTAISNINNLINDPGEENVQIELLMNGTGVKIMMKEGEHRHRLEYLAEKGVDLKVCSNSLEGFKISEKELLDEAQSVPAGVTELVKKQDDGWSYIKI